MTDDKTIQEWDVEPVKQVIVAGKVYVITSVTMTGTTVSIELEDEWHLRSRLQEWSR